MKLEKPEIIKLIEKEDKEFILSLIDKCEKTNNKDVQNLIIEIIKLIIKPQYYIKDKT